MAKKTTTTTKTAAPTGAAAKPASASTNIIGEPPAPSAATNGAVATAEAPKTPRAATKPKQPGTPKPKAKPESTTAPAVKKVGFTQDDVALRAYFIAETRRTVGLPGDEHTDWIEAERQLKAESKRGGKARRV